METNSLCTLRKNEITAFSAFAAMAYLDNFGATDSSLGMIDDLPINAQSHKVYNFEVSGTHNYIADGIRVHNTSVLSFLSTGETITDIKFDASGRPVEYTATVDDEFGTVKVTTKTIEGTNTIEVSKEYVYTRDGRNIQLHQIDVVQIDPETGEEKIIGSRIVDVNLDGSRIGEGALQALTPFLAHSLIGDDASLMTQLATNTVLDTVLGNVGEFLGSALHHSFLEADTNGSVIQQLSEHAFEDFGGDLALAGVENAVSLVNQLIMAEIFESVEMDGIGGEVFQAIIGTQVNGLVSAGANFILEELAGIFPDNDFLGQLSAEYTAAGFNFNPISIIFTAVINEILPPHETTEGAIAAAITTAALAIWGGLSAKFGAVLGGPIGMVIGWFVGTIFDGLFGGSNPIPQAWTNVGFDEDTGLFVVLGTWQDDGGDTGLSKAMAEAYVSGINGFITTLQAQSHNYDELGNWTFGHYFETLKNAGRNGQNYNDAQDAYMAALMTDMREMVVNDGNLAAGAVLDQINMQYAYNHSVEFKNFVLNNNTFMNNQNLDRFYYPFTPPSFSGDVNSPTLFLEKIEWIRDYHKVLTDHYNMMFDYFRAVMTGNGNGPVNIGALHGYINGVIAPMLREMASFLRFVDALNITSTEEYLEAYSRISSPSETIPVEIIPHDNEEQFQILFSNLQIAHDYHNYLENSETINEIIAAAPNSVFAASWIATLSAAHDMGLDDAYEVTGDEIDNVFYAADGNDSINGLSGDDLIVTYGGDDFLNGHDDQDTLHGGTGNDTLWGGNGDDWLHGGNGDDTLEGGSGDAGADTLHGGRGNDILKGQAGDDFLNGHDDQDTLHGGEGNDTLWGGNGDDWLHGGNGDDTLEGGSGDAGADTLHGGRGNDILSGKAGDDFLNGHDDQDTLHGGEGHDTLWGGNGDDWLHGGNGNDTLEGGSGDDGADTLYGGRGDDLLNGRAGNDLLSGGDGADRFIFADGHGQDIITDFDVTEPGECIALRNVSAITSFADLMANHISETDGTAIISDGAGNTITLQNVRISDLSEDDFLF